MPIWARLVAPYAEQVAHTYGQLVAGKWAPRTPLTGRNARSAAAAVKARKQQIMTMADGWPSPAVQSPGVGGTRRGCLLPAWTVEALLRDRGTSDAVNAGRRNRANLRASDNSVARPSPTRDRRRSGGDERTQTLISIPTSTETGSCRV
jgi:hypothetical protein